MKNNIFIILFLTFGYCYPNPIISKLQIEYGTNIFINSIQATAFLPINQKFDFAAGYQIGLFNHQSDPPYDDLLGFYVDVENLHLRLITNIFDVLIGYKRNGNPLNHFFSWFGIGISYFVAIVKEDYIDYGDKYVGSKIWDGLFITTKIDIFKTSLSRRLDFVINFKARYTALSLPLDIDMSSATGKKETFTLASDEIGSSYYNIFYPEIGFALNYCIGK